MMDRYEPQAPCPHCFESSGYEARVNAATWYEPAWADADPTRPCPFCDGTGSVPASEVGPDDWLSEWSADFHSDEWAAAAEQVA